MKKLIIHLGKENISHTGLIYPICTDFATLDITLKCQHVTCKRCKRSISYQKLSTQKPSKVATQGGRVALQCKIKPSNWDKAREAAKEQGISLGKFLDKLIETYASTGLAQHSEHP
jgi:hypothetical protein